jgi:hypothetical protein
MTAPAYEQLAAQERIIAQLQARIPEQDADIAELVRQPGASSRNSSKPPSTDGWTRRHRSRCGCGVVTTTVEPAGY